jgi:hypothetical protein
VRAQTLDVAAGEQRELSFEAPATPKAQTAPPATRAAAPAPKVQSAALTAPAARRDRATPSGRLAPVWFWGAAGLTAVSGVAAIISGVDTLDRQSEYRSVPTRARYEAGQDSELRTNVLIGSTAALLVASGVLYAFTDFEGDEEQVSPSLTATPDSAVLLLRRSFR